MSGLLKETINFSVYNYVLLSAGYLHLRFGELIFGGAYYWNFMVQ